MTDLQTLLDEREITRALSRFARILDEKRWDDLADVFAEDLSFEYGSGVEQQGMDALRATMRQFLDVCGGTQHLLGSLLIDVAGDRAVSRAYVQARHQHKHDPLGPIFDSTGEYVDRWERRPQGWRIVRRDAVWFLHSGDPGVLSATAADLG
jgi:ketosteroid isomerase-like protein